MLIQAPYFADRFERGIAIVSLDAELIWGYLDLFDEAQFCRRYPNVTRAYDRLLELLCSAGISATWFLVGGMALAGSDGVHDSRMVRLPYPWVRRIRPGNEATQPLWYRQSFVRRLRDAQPSQELGLHGGLTHLIWTAPEANSDTVKSELQQGLRALKEAGIRPRSFSFPRNQEAYHELLWAHGFSCFRGRPCVLSHRLGRTLPGALLRAFEEAAGMAPPPVWPREVFPGLWNIPASLFLYPMGSVRSVLVPLRSRLARVRRGLMAAIRHKAVFHYCLHAANLAESPLGFSLFEEILKDLIRARDRGDAEILTVGALTERLRHKGIGDVPAALQPAAL